MPEELAQTVRIELGEQQDVDDLKTLDGNLCQQCEQVDLDDVFSHRPAPMGRCVISNLGIVDETWEKRPCPICRLMAAIRPRRIIRVTASEISDDHTHQLQAFSSTDIWLCQGNLGRHQRLPRQWIDTVFLAVTPTDSSQYTQEKRNRFQSARSWSRDDQFRDAVLRSGFVARNVSSDKIDFGVIRDWIGVCVNSQPRRCKSRAIKQAPSLRLIECATGIIVETTQAVPFVALSYVWGSVPGVADDSATDSKNHQVVGDVEVEPVVKDAMTVARELGYNYLWVDRYCIEKLDNAVRQGQLDNMDAVYGSADVTIVAAAGTDSSFSLPGIRPRQPRKQPARARVKGHTLVSIPPDPATILKPSTWATREAGLTKKVCCLAVA
ncbi:hypothetical protein OQA88_6083 [Cercophora sp. LCS_1]